MYDVLKRRQATIAAIRAQSPYAIATASRIELLLAVQSLKTKPVFMRFSKFQCIA